MPFNVGKCKVLYYGKGNENASYFMNEELISMDDSIKDLGVNFNNDMKFHNHICKITATARSRLAVIRRTF